MRFVSWAEHFGVEKGLRFGGGNSRKTGARAHKKARTDIAKRLMAQGVNPDFIAEITDLPVRKIRKLSVT